MCKYLLYIYIINFLRYICKNYVLLYKKYEMLQLKQNDIKINELYKQIYIKDILNLKLICTLIFNVIK